VQRFCSNLGGKSIEPIVLSMKVGIRSLQRLMTGRDWDDRAMHHLYKERLTTEITSHDGKNNPPLESLYCWQNRWTYKQESFAYNIPVHVGPVFGWQPPKVS
ncbi:MAG: hypothetical protein M1509_06475, partial [Nitrospirae bacterium]|nr:hypothetical protein [Nitrospirota bacterium]